MATPNDSVCRNPVASRTIALFMGSVDADIVIIGAGAAGLMAALAARGVVRADGESCAPSSSTPRVIVLDSSRRVGAKILISGGGRCNVTNEVVQWWGGAAEQVPKGSMSVPRNYGFQIGRRF